MSLSAHLMDRLVPMIHRFSLMTYDYRPPSGKDAATEQQQNSRTAAAWKMP